MAAKKSTKKAPKIGKKQTAGGKQARESDIDSDKEPEDVQSKRPQKRQQVEVLDSEVEEIDKDVEPPEEEVQVVDDDQIGGRLEENEVSTVLMTKQLNSSNHPSSYRTQTD